MIESFLAQGKFLCAIMIYSLVINNGLDEGTQLPYIRTALQRGYAVLILNTNHNSHQGRPIPVRTTHYAPPHSTTMQALTCDCSFSYTFAPPRCMHSLCVMRYRGVRAQRRMQSMSGTHMFRLICIEEAGAFDR